MEFSLEQLEAFVGAAENGSFSAAARKLGKAQSAVSTAVANLEIDLGVDLFDRSGKYPVLTVEGNTLLRDAKMILSHCSALQERAFAFADDVDSRIRLAVDEIVPHHFFIEVLERFDKRFPETELEILYGALGDIQMMVAEGRADIGILVPADIPDRTVSFRLVSRMTFHPVAAPDHPLAARKEVSRSDLEVHRQLVATSRGSGPEPEPTIFGSRIWMLESTYAILDLVRRGVGWAFLPKHLVAEDLAAGQLVRLPAVFEKTAHTAPVYLLWAAGRRIGKSGRWLLEKLADLND